MPHLLRLDNLEFLDLSDNPIVDSDLSKLLQLDWIDSLSLSSTQITDARIPDLATMRNLRFLYLKKTRIFLLSFSVCFFLLLIFLFCSSHPCFTHTFREIQRI